MITLRLLGGAALVGEHGQVTGRAVQRRRLALLALLAAVRKPLSRDRVTSYFWPESDSEQARHLLSVAVYELRKATHEDAIISTRDEVALNAAHISSDVDAFEQALARGDYEQAVATYAGPFLDGFHINDAPDFERWVDGERDRLARAYASALEQLAEQQARAGHREAAIATLRKLSAHDPIAVASPAC
jgi:DNA-binding SARP family transcriptional activator